MAQCVVCSEDIDATAAKSFPCCDALYCDACHEETAEGGTCGECFADLTAAAAPPPPPADSTPQLAPALRPLTPTVFAVAPKPTMVALGTPSDCGTPNRARIGHARARAPARGRPAPRRAAQGRRQLAAVLAATRTVAQDRHRAAVGGAKADGQRRDAADGDGETLQRRGEGASPPRASRGRARRPPRPVRAQAAAVAETAARRQAAERAAAARSRKRSAHAAAPLEVAARPGTVREVAAAPLEVAAAVVGRPRGGADRGQAEDGRGRTVRGEPQADHRPEAAAVALAAPRGAPRGVVVLRRRVVLHGRERPRGALESERRAAAAQAHVAALPGDRSPQKRSGCGALLNVTH